MVLKSLSAPSLTLSTGRTSRVVLENDGLFDLQSDEPGMLRPLQVELF